MRKRILVASCLAVILMTCACTNENTKAVRVTEPSVETSLSAIEPNSEPMPTVEPVVKPTQEPTQEPSQEPSVGASDELDTSTENEIDVDLTLLGSTMVYAEVYQMMTDPDQYEGKVIKMSGTYSPYYYEDNGNYYFYVVIADATECCSQGMEFVWDNGSHIYPDEYPSEGDIIEIVGTFETYMEGDKKYCHILTDNIKVIQ